MNFRKLTNNSDHKRLSVPQKLDTKFCYKAAESSRKSIVDIFDAFERKCDRRSVKVMLLQAFVKQVWWILLHRSHLHAKAQHGGNGVVCAVAPALLTQWKQNQLKFVFGKFNEIKENLKWFDLLVERTTRCSVVWHGLAKTKRLT